MKKMDQIVRAEQDTVWTRMTDTHVTVSEPTDIWRCLDVNDDV